MKRIAVMTSGGDSSGMNACVRAVVRKAISENLEVVGIQKGFQGLIDRNYQLMTSHSVSGILQRGGTVLHSARCKAMMEEAGQKLAAENLRGLGVEGIIVIGGEGSLKGALCLNKRGIPAIGIPASIDNDIPFTDMSLGVDTALNNIVYAVDCLKDTASSHGRAFVVECMGRHCGEPEEGWQLISWLCNTEGQKIISLGATVGTSRLSLKDWWINNFQIDREAFMEQERSGYKWGRETPNTRTVAWGEISNMLKSAFDPVNLGTSTAEDACIGISETLTAKMIEVYDKNKITAQAVFPDFPVE